MRQKFFPILALFFCCAFSRPVTFEDRDVCEESGGVWRQFGNSCVDSCEAKLNELSICTKITVSSCECGKSRCFDDEKKICVALKDYKKIFDARLAEERKLAEEMRKKREEQSTKSEQSILSNLEDKKEEKESNQNTSNEDKPKEVEAEVKPQTPPLENPLKTPSPQPPSPTINNNSAPVPPLFLKKEQEKKDKEIEKKEPEKNSTITDPSPIGLPVIPLPN